MSESSSPSGERPSSAEDAYAQFLKLRESGSAPDFETWVREYPEFERELRALEESWDSIGESIGRVLASTVIVPPEPLAPSLAPGLQVGEFVLVRRIGVGGMGVVWLARQPALGRHVALKFVRPDRETAQSAELFAREARAAGRVNDPRIVTVYAVGESGGLRWLAQEYVPDSRGLMDWLHEMREAGPPPDRDRRAAAFVADVAEALHAAHAAGVVHRDVKPQNLLMSPEGAPKITDFGLARLMDELPLSESLSIRGTVQYSSPEQVTGAEVDGRSDVFSLGVVLYELLTLAHPFAGLNLLEVIAAITAREARPPGELRPGLASELGVIVRKAMEKEPSERYPSALELARDLRRWLAHEPIAARPRSLRQRLAKWIRRHSARLLLGSVAGLLLAGAAWGWVWHGKIVEGRKDLLVKQMHFDVNDGRMVEARSRAASFLALDEDDPEAHLILAMGYARFLRFSEADEQLALAVELGYDPELGADPSAEDRYRRALWLVAQRDSRLHPEAAQLLEQAASSEAHQEFLWFPLYQMRDSIGDREGARAALVQFTGSLRVGDDFTSVAEALLAELDGEHLRAVEALEALRDRISEGRARELRLHRHLGGNYLLECLTHPGERPDLLELAEDELRRAVADFPDDGNARAALALVQKSRADLEVDPVARERCWTEAERLARSATEQGLGLVRGSEVLAMVAFDRFAADFDVERSDERDLDEIERRLNAVRRLEPDSPLIPILTASVAYHRGAYAHARGDRLAARRLWSESVEANERQLYARVCLAQLLFLDDSDYSGALALLQEALALWDSKTYGVPGFDPTQERKWLFATTIWIFGAADHAGEVDLARQAAQRAVREIESDDRGFEPEDVESLAEFFALPKNVALKDCERALSLLDAYDVDEHFEGDAAVEALLAKIRGACE